jgi:hypothetical protein
MRQTTVSRAHLGPAVCFRRLGPPCIHASIAAFHRSQPLQAASALWRTLTPKSLFASACWQPPSPTTLVAVRGPEPMTPNMRARAYCHLFMHCALMHHMNANGPGARAPRQPNKLTRPVFPFNARHRAAPLIQPPLQRCAQNTPLPFCTNIQLSAGLLLRLSFFVPSLGSTLDTLPPQFILTSSLPSLITTFPPAS